MAFPATLKGPADSPAAAQTVETRASWNGRWRGPLHFHVFIRGSADRPCCPQGHCRGSRQHTLLSDRAGGLYTILAASICQAVAIAGFILTQDEAGLFAVSAAFGAGFSGIIPAYVVVLRQIFPAGEASWRVPVWFFANICGMALGGWLAGAMYDQFGSYAPAFVAGVAFNVANIALIGWLAIRLR